MSPLRVRREQLADDLPVVRGGRLSAGSVRRDAALCFRRFGEYGISALRASHELEVERLAGGPLRYFDVLTVLKVGDAQPVVAVVAARLMMPRVAR